MGFRLTGQIFSLYSYSWKAGESLGTFYPEVSRKDEMIAILGKTEMSRLLPNASHAACSWHAEEVAVQ